MLSSTDLNKIPVKNLYYMLCYAWDHLQEKDFARVAREDEKDIKHLLARILLVKLRSLMRRGFYKDYIVLQEETPTIRGKILFQESLNTFSFHRARMHCRYEEMDYDILHNQIIKSTLHTLLQSSELDKSLKDEVLQVYKYFARIRLIELHHSHFEKIRLHRNNRYYQFVLDICRFLYESLLLHEVRSGEETFADFDRNPRAMARLFEEFVRKFYKYEAHLYRVYRENIYWDAEGDDLSYLPIMQTDISLENKERKIIIDTKYYRQTLREHRGAEKLASENLYQLFAYLNNVKKEHKPVLGILLYPTTGKELNLSYHLKEYPVHIYTVNLNRHWHYIHKRLLTIINQWDKGTG